MSDIQGRIDAIYDKQKSNQFGTERYAYFFKPGAYALDVQIGFYMQALGLGAKPDDVAITGAVRSKADWDGGNATLNFWRSAENLAVTPTQDGNTNVWAVSQATSFRRMHVHGPMILSDGGWSSGGFIADSVVDDTLSSGTQQQFLTRNSKLGQWNGGAWNMVFVGVENAPSGSWPSSPYSVVDTTPVVREKPYLTIDDGGHYGVVVPSLTHDSKGPTWTTTSSPSTTTTISTDAFYVAHADKDGADSINTALAAGKHLLLTPGIYHLTAPVHVARAGTIVMGLGLATLVPDLGTSAMDIDDVDDVSVSGLVFEAGPRTSSTLLRVGTPGGTASHASSPTMLFDLTCRVGGAVLGTTDTCVTIESADVITDNTWMWRADHGEGADWNGNKAKHGFVVDGRNVTSYGLFVEHFQEYQTMWNGEGGRVYFYQSELPYDPPSQADWTHDGVNGYASYKVAEGVTAHQAIGLGVYCVFYNPVVEDDAIETPTAPGVSMHHMVTEWLGVDGSSAIAHVINGGGARADSGSRESRTSD
jgi:hypothetical protein